MEHRWSTGGTGIEGSKNGVPFHYAGFQLSLITEDSPSFLSVTIWKLQLKTGDPRVQCPLERAFFSYALFNLFKGRGLCGLGWLKTRHVAEVGFEHLIFLPPPPEGCDCVCGPPCKLLRI